MDGADDGCHVCVVKEVDQLVCGHGALGIVVEADAKNFGEQASTCNNVDDFAVQGRLPDMRT